MFLFLSNCQRGEKILTELGDELSLYSIEPKRRKKRIAFGLLRNTKTSKYETTLSSIKYNNTFIYNNSSILLHFSSNAHHVRSCITLLNFYTQPPRCSIFIFEEKDCWITYKKLLKYHFIVLRSFSFTSCLYSIPS